MNPIPMRFGGYQPPASVHNRAAEIFGTVLRTQLGSRSNSASMAISWPPVVRLPIYSAWSKAAR